MEMRSTSPWQEGASMASHARHHLEGLFRTMSSPRLGLPAHMLLDMGDFGLE